VIPEVVIIQFLYAVARQRLADMRLDERGEITEKVIITAVFAGLAIAAGAIIVAKVTAKANDIPTE
jgi:hypothetical protein